MLVQDLPMIGLGTFGIPKHQIPTAVACALDMGFRRIDCAPVYFNEDAIGDALQEALTGKKRDLDRKDLYLVSKLAGPFHRKEHVKIGLQKTLQDLRQDYLDLYLIHWPQAFHYVPIDMNRRGYPDESIGTRNADGCIDTEVSIHETWEAMEELVEEGLVRSIGVSNFSVSLIHELMTKCKIPPAVNQVELHPYLQQPKLVEYCNGRGVHVQGYSPLGTPGYKIDKEPNVLADPLLADIAAKYGINSAQLCLLWAVQRGTSVVAKSASSQRQADNIEMEKSGIVLAEDDMEQIASLDLGYRFFRPEDWWGSLGMAVFD